jgi:type VI protein secretion system component VasK
VNLAGSVGLVLLAAGGALLLGELVWLAIRLLRFRGRALRLNRGIREQTAELEADLRRLSELRQVMAADMAVLARQTRLARFAAAQLVWYRRQRALLGAGRSGPRG